MSAWHVGLPGAITAEDRVVAFNAAELLTARAAGAAVALGFHEAVTAHVDRACEVEVHLPAYRGLAFVPVLAWLAARLAGDEAPVSWYAGKQQGPDSIRKLLEGAGWRLERDRAGRLVRLRGRPPAERPERPPPRGYNTLVGGRRVELAADYGVFSPERLDEGTALLLEVALRHPPVERVADIGVGCGPLAIGLVLGGAAPAAVGTDIDCIALWLAGENARACGVPLALACSPDPAAIEPTPLTVCNVPTHIDRHETKRFMAALAARARAGRLLAVVHASLEARYTRHLEAHGLRVERHPGAAHVVLEAGR